MCEYCGCQSVPAIAELTAEHDQIREVARELDTAASGADLPVARAVADRLTSLTAPKAWPMRVQAVVTELLDDILREQDGLFPATLSVLTPQQWDELQEVRRGVTAGGRPAEHNARGR